MRVLTFGISGVVAVATLLAVAPSGAAVNPRTVLSRPVRQIFGGVPAVRPRPRSVSSPSGCTTQYSTTAGYAFTGVTMGGDVAGGDNSGVLAGNSNEACDEGDAIAGGLFNTISNGGAAYYSAIGGGEYNGVTGENSFIGNGAYNLVNGNGSFVGSGGYANYLQGIKIGNQVSGLDSFAGAGDTNVVAADQAFLGAGYSNTISSAASYGLIAAGGKNLVSAPYSSVFGGFGNTASGSYAIVAGGNSSTAGGTLSFAAGYHADAVHNGSFVWSDYSSGSKLVSDAVANQFVVRASGGTTVYSNEGMTAGVKLAAGAGSWANLSDRNAKTDIAPLDDATVLAKVAALPVTTWRYKSESGVRHAGPMAQDFYAAFGVGEDDRHITTIDEDGIAFAAIKALHRENAALRRELARMRATQAARDAALEARLDALTKR